MAVTFQQFEFFRAVARSLSFSSAAKDMYTSQPYVSNQIRKLEEHFGVPLFVRSQPRVALTEAGQVLYDRITRILEDVQELEQVVQQFQGLRRGTINVAATASAGNHFLPELVASFHRAYPDIVVQVRVGNTEDVLEWLGLDEVEIAVSPQGSTTRDLVAEPFYREQLIVIFPADLEVESPLSAEILATLPRVVREDGSLTLAKMNELLGEYPAGTEYVAQLGGTTAVNEAVAAGLGVSLVPERSAKAWLDAGSVRSCPLAGPPLHHDFYLIYARRRFLTPAARAFIEHVRESTKH